MLTTIYLTIFTFTSTHKILKIKMGMKLGLLSTQWT